VATEAILYDPLPVFLPFHGTQSRAAALIGGYGSGKSRALVAEALKLGLAHPGSEHLISRKTIPSLRDTTESDFLDQIPEKFLRECKIQRGGGHVQTLILPNHSKYYFKGLDDWKKIKSLNLMGIFVDEADEIDEETYDGLITRLRQSSPRPAAARAGAPRIPFNVIRLACNPAGKNWIWRRFVKEANRQNVGFLSTSLDNPYNPREYIESLLAYPDPWVRRYVFCSFDDFEGTIYPAWDWGTHVIEPYGIGSLDPNGFVWMGMDPGTAHPTAGVWAYWDPRINRMVGIAEYIAEGVDVSTHADEWRKIERHGTHNLSRMAWAMNVTKRIADPTIATRDRGSMMSLERQYGRKGFHFEHGPREIPARLPMLGELIHTGQFVVTKELEQSYWQIKNYRYEDLSPVQREKGAEAKPLKKEVDLVDGWQYIASRRLPDPKIKPIDPDAQATGLNAELEGLRAKAQLAREAGHAAVADETEAAAQDLEDRLLGTDLREIAEAAAKKARGEHRHPRSAATRGF
jgi:PBSX family phage terminase large subunit